MSAYGWPAGRTSVRLMEAAIWCTWQGDKGTQECEASGGCDPLWSGLYQEGSALCLW